MFGTYAQYKRSQSRRRAIHRKYVEQKRKEEMGAEKKYPFDLAKHGLELEMVRNLLLSKFINNEDVSPKMRMWATDRRERIKRIVFRSDGFQVVWLNGQEYGFVRKAISWAEAYIEQEKEMVRKELGELK